MQNTHTLIQLIESCFLRRDQYRFRYRCSVTRPLVFEFATCPKVYCYLHQVAYAGMPGQYASGKPCR